VESDPIGLKAGLNVYAYVNGTPLRSSDARGLEPPGSMRQRGYFGPLKCPTKPPKDSAQWRRYPKPMGEAFFHCGFKCYLERKSPLPYDMQGECCYDESDGLVGSCHKYRDCEGSPNQYDQDDDKWNHTFRDSGGVASRGLQGLSDSVGHAMDTATKR
jgi:uncharacterized protein RhaS with RHS repeats